jgi:hypothetical protein
VPTAYRLDPGVSAKTVPSDSEVQSSWKYFIWNCTLKHIWRVEKKIIRRKALINVSCLLTFLFRSEIISKATGVQIWCPWWWPGGGREVAGYTKHMP